MNSRLSSPVKLGLSWERFYLGLCYWISIPLKCWLKYAACNVDKIYEKKDYFGINRIWPRDRLSCQ